MESGHVIYTRENANKDLQKVLQVLKDTGIDGLEDSFLNILNETSFGKPLILTPSNIDAVFDDIFGAKTVEKS